MKNRCKTLLRDHLVPEVTLKACPRHYSVSAVPETLTEDLKDLPYAVMTSTPLLSGQTPISPCPHDYTPLPTNK